MFMEASQNPPSGNERGVILHAPENGPQWFVVFSFNETGYIKDDEKDSLDAEAILESVREGTEEANEIRRERGWSTISVTGWQVEPYYDTETNNLTWSMLAGGSDGEVVNHSVRLLGRRGVMNADLVLAPEDVDSAVETFSSIVGGFDFKSGHRYREFTSGDRVAEIGLTALVAGGAGVALAKSGLLAKFWKVIVAGVVALLALAKRAVAALTGRSPQSQSA
jgi:uncharacterized membrane-anchored protein